MTATRQVQFLNTAIKPYGGKIVYKQQINPLTMRKHNIMFKNVLPSSRFFSWTPVADIHQSIDRYYLQQVFPTTQSIVLVSFFSFLYLPPFIDMKLVTKGFVLKLISRFGEL